jgi:hypothetical protein
MILIVASLLTLFLAVPPQPADLAAAFPEGRLAALRVPSGQELFDSAPLQLALTRLREHGALAELDAGRAALRLATGSDPADWLAFLLGGEVQLGIYAPLPSKLADEGSGERRLLAVARTRDAEGCQRILDAVLGVIESDQGNVVRRSRYRDVACVRINHELVVARLAELLLVASDDDLLAAALDRLLDGAPPVATVPAGGGLLAFSLDPELLRPRDWKPLAGEARRALGKRIANPLGNLLFGGLLLGEGAIDGSLGADGSTLELRVALPPAPADAPAAWFPPGAAAFAVPATPQTLGVLALRRDLSGWWRERESLMSEDSQPQLAKTDETLSLLFMGGSPAEDVFAALGPELAVVVDRQTFADAPEPDVKLPGACLVAHMHDPQAFGPAVQVAFQTLVGFLNTDRAQKRQAPFLIDAFEHEGTVVRAARLLPREGEEPGTDSNASPAVAVVDDWLLVGTSLEQVRGLVDALHAGALRKVGGGPFSLTVDGAGLLALARDDRDVLVAQHILEEGLSAEEAGRKVDNLLALLGDVRSLDLSVTRAADGLDVLLRLALGDGAP